MSSLVVIPARGGSKRIPKKNIKDFCGKPIIAYSIEAAIESQLFDEVMVSTDDKEIREIALEYGANVPFLRSKDNSGDMVSSSDVINEVLQNYEEFGKEFDIIVCLYPTAPFVTSKKIRSAYKKFEESGAKSLVSVVKYSFPPQRSFSIVNNRIKVNFPDFIECRSQDLKDIYHDAGQLYMARVEYYKKEKRFYSDDTIPFVLDEIEVQDIDTYTDWQIAQLKYKLIRGE
ncbi:MAG: pseudaminic acid cytidylyltransferase [Coprobacillus cateniformis]|uniref:pseudaminic acid cytidylyltransferase n=1 Tax=Longibaculum muris TaxID=1796628 RepID=UPI003AB5D2A1|nr:pseudaminic acid cytidylyltransferase [Coprobacillus cateniformis]